jgi:hypothetical protein
VATERTRTTTIDDRRIAAPLSRKRNLPLIVAVAGVRVQCMRRRARRT